MATTNIRYVDPNSTTGGDGTTNALTGANRAYVSLTAWEAARQADLPTGDIIERCICSSDDAGSTHAADTTACSIFGWTTDATRYIQIESASSHVGVWDSSIYRLEVSDADCLLLNEDFVNVIGLQIQLTSTTTAKSCLYVQNGGVGAGAIHNISKCIIKGAISGTIVVAYGIRIADADATYNVRNTIAYDFVNGTTSTIAMYVAVGTGNFSNCTVHNSYLGYYNNAGTALWKNCGAASCNTGFTGGTQTTCSVASPTFVNEAGDDFHLAAGDTTWKDQGTDLSGTFTDDIDGQTRSGTWDIGADEYVAAGGGPAPVVISRSRIVNAGKVGGCGASFLVN